MTDQYAFTVLEEMAGEVAKSLPPVEHQKRWIKALKASILEFIVQIYDKMTSENPEIERDLILHTIREIVLSQIRVDIVDKAVGGAISGLIRRRHIRADFKDKYLDIISMQESPHLN